MRAIRSWLLADTQPMNRLTWVVCVGLGNLIGWLVGRFG